MNDEIVTLGFKSNECDRLEHENYQLGHQLSSLIDVFDKNTILNDELSKSRRNVSELELLLENQNLQNNVEDEKKSRMVLMIEQRDAKIKEMQIYIQDMNDERVAAIGQFEIELSVVLITTVHLIYCFFFSIFLFIPLVRFHFLFIPLVFVKSNMRVSTCACKTRLNRERSLGFFAHI